MMSHETSPQRQVMDAGLITFQAGSSFDATKAWHFMRLGEPSGRCWWQGTQKGLQLAWLIFG